jgi:hypothetical protein
MEKVAPAPLCNLRSMPHRSAESAAVNEDTHYGNGVPEALLVTGVFGVGKTSVVEEVAETLETAGIRYAALDLDWLCWGWPGTDTPEAGYQLMLENLASVVDNYRRRDVVRFLMAGTIETDAQLSLLSDTIAMPVRVVRLTLSIDQIRHRLAEAPTVGRADDFRRAEQMVASRTGESFGDLAVNNDRPLREVADEILDWLGWL